jgi:hypothetical protein
MSALTLRDDDSVSSAILCFIERAVGACEEMRGLVSHFRHTRPDTDAQRETRLLVAAAVSFTSGKES